MATLEKCTDAPIKKSSSTRTLYRNSCMKILERVASTSTHINTYNNVMSKRANAEKLREERKDFSIETDICILRRLCKEMKRKKMLKISKQKLSKLSSRKSSIFVLKIKHKSHIDKENVPKICTDEEEDIVIENLKMLMNKYIEKHKTEDDEVMTEITSWFRATLNRLTGNVVTPSILNVDEAWKRAYPRSIMLNIQRSEATNEIEECFKSGPRSNISNASMLAIPSETIEPVNWVSNCMPTTSGPKHCGEAIIVRKKVRLQKNADGRNTFLLCLDKSGSSLLSTASFEVLAITRKLPTPKEDFNKETVDSTVCGDAKVSKDSKYNNDIGIGTDEAKNKYEGEPVEDIVDCRQGEREELNMPCSLNSILTAEEIELNDEAEDVLCILNRDPSEKTVKFLVKPIKDERSRDTISSESYTKSLFDQGGCAAKRHQPLLVDSKNYYRMLARSFRNIQKSKFKRAMARIKNNKKGIKSTINNESFILRSECQDTKLTRKSLRKQFRKINDYLSNLKDKKNVTIDIVVKACTHSDNNNLDTLSNTEVIKGNNLSNKFYAAKKTNFIEVIESTNNDKNDNFVVKETETMQVVHTEKVQEPGNSYDEAKTTTTELIADVMKHDQQYLQDSNKSIEMIDVIGSTITHDRTQPDSEKVQDNTIAPKQIRIETADVIELLDASISHEKYLKTSDKYVEIIDELATCSYESLTAMVNKTKANLVSEVLQLVANAVSHDKHLPNYCNSHPYVIRASKSETSATPQEFTDKNINKINSDPVSKLSEMEQILSDLQFKLVYLTDTKRDSLPYKNERAKRLPTEEASFNYPCLGITTYDGRTFCLEDIGYLVTRFSSTSKILSKDTIESNCTGLQNPSKSMGECAFEISKEKNINDGEKQSAATQITIPFLKQIKPSRKAVKKTRSYNIIDSESIIKVTKMTSEPESSQFFDKSRNTKALTCSLPTSRAMFELVTDDTVSESNYVGFVSKEITRKPQEEQKLDQTWKKEKPSSQCDIEINREHDISLGCTDCAGHCSNTYAAKQLCYYLCAKHTNRDLEKSSSLVTEWDACAMSADGDSKLKRASVTSTKMKLLVFCAMSSLVLSIIVIYCVYFKVLDPSYWTNTETVVPKTVTFVNMKEMGFR